MKRPDFKDTEEEVDSITRSSSWWMLVTPDIYELVEQKIEFMEKKDLVSTVVSALIARKAIENLQWENVRLKWEIGELKQHMKETRGQKIDLLTGLPNNQQCHEDCSLESNRSIALLHVKNMFDINNAFGREKGDDIIKSLAKVLVKFTSGNKHGVYKFEWVDFGMIFEDGADEAYIREEYEKLQDFKVFDKNNKRIFLSFSLGIVLNESNIKTLIAHAYLALNVSKKVRKHVIFDQKKHISKRSEDFFEMGTLVREAFQEDLFEVHVQEIKKNSCTVQADTVRKFECLVRMYDSKEKTNLLSPGIFLDTIKNIWENQRLTALIIEKVCIFMTQNEHHYSINLTEDDLRSKDFATSIHEKIQSYNIQSERITFEILEEIEDTHFEHILENIQNLKKLGYGIAIDDFWTKFSNFSRMLDLNPTILKIDMSFIRWIDKSPKHRSLVRAIVGLAHENGILVVGEGIETSEEQHAMEELEVDFCQGYLHDKPGPVISK